MQSPGGLANDRNSLLLKGSCYGSRHRQLYNSHERRGVMRSPRTGSHPFETRGDPPWSLHNATGSVDLAQELQRQVPG